MKIEKLSADHIRAVLRSQEQRIKDILDAIEMDDAGAETLVDQIRLVEDSLRRVRLAAA
jgi:hypothetical protein